MMSIKEIERPLSNELIEYAHPGATTSRIPRPFTVIYLHEFNQYNMESFIDKYIGSHVVVLGNTLKFHKSLYIKLGRKDCENIKNNKRIHFGKYWLEISGTGFDFFIMRKGNNYGSIWNVDEEITKEEMTIRYEATLTECAKVGWFIDRLMPPSLLATDLLNKFVHWNALPDISSGDIEWIHLYRAYQCLKPPHLEAAAIGNARGTKFDYDINWAHAHSMKYLSSFHPRWFDIIDSPKQPTDDGHIVEAYLHAKVYIESPLGVLAIRVGVNNIVKSLNPGRGEYEGYWCKRNLDLVTRNKLGDVEIIGGSWIVPNCSDIPYPFVKAISILEKLRDNPRMRSFAKAISPLVWGRFASQWKSPYFNPLYAASVPSIVSERISRIALYNVDNLISIAADGLVTRKPLQEVDVIVSDLVGDMKVKEIPDLISLSDLYRDYKGNDKQWEAVENGIWIPSRYAGLQHVLMYGGTEEDIGRDLGGQMQDYGSGRRNSPRGITLPWLMNNYEEIAPPDEEAIVDIMCSKRRDAPWESIWFPELT